MISERFPDLNGLKLSLLQTQPLKGPTTNAVQIFHVNGNHWIVAATAKAGKSVCVYDSAHTSLDQVSATLIKNFFRYQYTNIKMVPVQKQHPGSNDCGVFAIANAIAIAFGEDPSMLHSNQTLMRTHLIECLTMKSIEVFPCQ